MSDIIKLPRTRSGRARSPETKSKTIILDPTIWQKLVDYGELMERTLGIRPSLPQVISYLLHNAGKP